MERPLSEEARRLAPRIHEYGGLAVECADGVVRFALPATTRQYGGRLAALGREYTDLGGFHMSQTDGVPVPDNPGDFLDDSPPYGDPL